MWSSRIRDYGPGIPEEELPHVKEKFYKGSSKARGNGIGLAVCDEIVQPPWGTIGHCQRPGRPRLRGHHPAAHDQRHPALGAARSGGDKIIAIPLKIERMFDKLEKEVTYA